MKQVMGREWKNIKILKTLFLPSFVGVFTFDKKREKMYSRFSVNSNILASFGNGTGWSLDMGESIDDDVRRDSMVEPHKFTYQIQFLKQRSNERTTRRLENEDVSSFLFTVQLTQARLA